MYVVYNYVYIYIICMYNHIYNYVNMCYICVCDTHRFCLFNIFPPVTRVFLFSPFFMSRQWVSGIMLPEARRVGVILLILIIFIILSH